MKRILIISVLLAILSTVKAQSTVMEIRWDDSMGIIYTGLVVLHPNNLGFIKIKYYVYPYGWVWCVQDIVRTFKSDVWGNVTTYLTGSNPRISDSRLGYAADVFIIYPNGAMYTQDASGQWSTKIRAVIIEPTFWKAKFNEYGLNR